MSVIEGERLPRSHYSEVGKPGTDSEFPAQFAGNSPLSLGFPHCTIRFTVASWPPMESFSACVPVGASEGIDTFTWYNPTKVGAKPLNSTGAVLPPMVAVGDVLVRVS